MYATFVDAETFKSGFLAGATWCGPAGGGGGRLHRPVRVRV